MAFYKIIFSPTGGVQKVTDVISKELSENINTIDLTQNNADFSNFRLQDKDIAIIAMPSFGGRAPQVAIERLKQIKSNNSPAILICAYGNRAYEDTLVEMQDVAQNIGFNVIAAIAAITEHSISRQYGSNRPDDKDIIQLKEFSKKIKEKIYNRDDSKLKISGQRPYKKSGNVGLIPKTNKKCTDCKKCAALCPMGAISKTNVKIIDKTRCISCMRCVSTCPNGAKEINKFMAKIISFVLKKVCTERKENELFIV